jgi:hypothetical protein
MKNERIEKASVRLSVNVLECFWAEVWLWYEKIRRKTYERRGLRPAKEKAEKNDISLGVRRKEDQGQTTQYEQYSR